MVRWGRFTPGCAPLSLTRGYCHVVPLGLWIAARVGRAGAETWGSALLAKLEGLFNVSEQTAGHGETFPVLQHDNVLAFKHGLKFFHPVEIDDGASADAKKS